MKQSADILIVGGGVIGCALARELTKRGAAVIVFESGAKTGCGATGASVGILSYAPSRPKPKEWHELARNAVESHKKLSLELPREVSNAPKWNWIGRINIAASQEAEQRIRLNLKNDLEAGIRGQWLKKKEIHGLEPMLAGKVLGGVIEPDNGEVDPLEITRALEASAKAAGAEFIFNTKVERILAESNTAKGVFGAGKEYLAKHIIVAAGAWAGQLDPSKKIDVEPVRGQAIELEIEGEKLISHIIFGKGIYLVPRKNGIIIGATHEHVGFQLGNTVGGISKLVSNASALVPRLSEYNWEKVRMWSGLRPCVSRGFPIIGPDPEKKGLWWATGHHTNGILLAPISAAILSEEICNGKVSENLFHLRP